MGEGLMTERMTGSYSHYENAHTCFACPSRNFDAPAGSTSFADCSCAAGYYGPAGGPCEPCPSGTFKDTSGEAASCEPCPRSGQWSPRASDSSSNCIFKASGLSVIDYHGNLLYNLTDEFVFFDMHGNQHRTLVPMDGEGSWQERWHQHQDRVEGWEAELRAETKRRLEHERAEEGPRQTLRAQRDADLGKPRPYKRYIQPHQVSNVFFRPPLAPDVVKCIVACLQRRDGM